ncbi:unnamed protein product [Cylindrotheca closterium]|uniref:Uncharacterized protein n=1 Tax=Cylindrotheca closterium TaxID=2856 RepID=A0AAD2CHQ4_9STRA|nr:unnamed protein product [Cylindrotheca closterium]
MSPTFSFLAPEQVPRFLELEKINRDKLEEHLQYQEHEKEWLDNEARESKAAVRGLYAQRHEASDRKDDFLSDLQSATADYIEFKNEIDVEVTNLNRNIDHLDTMVQQRKERASQAEHASAILREDIAIRNKIKEGDAYAVWTREEIEHHIFPAPGGLQDLFCPNKYNNKKIFRTLRRIAPGFERNPAFKTYLLSEPYKRNFGNKIPLSHNTNKRKLQALLVFLLRGEIAYNRFMVYSRDPSNDPDPIGIMNFINIPQAPRYRRPARRLAGTRGATMDGATQHPSVPFLTGGQNQPAANAGPPGATHRFGTFDSAARHPSIPAVTGGQNQPAANAGPPATAGFPSADDQDSNEEGQTDSSNKRTTVESFTTLATSPADQENNLGQEMTPSFSTRRPGQAMQTNNVTNPESSSFDGGSLSSLNHQSRINSGGSGHGVATTNWTESSFATTGQLERHNCNSRAVLNINSTEEVKEKSKLCYQTPHERIRELEESARVQSQEIAVQVQQSAAQAQQIAQLMEVNDQLSVRMDDLEDRVAATPKPSCRERRNPKKGVSKVASKSHRMTLRSNNHN